MNNQSSIATSHFLILTFHFNVYCRPGCARSTDCGCRNLSDSSWGSPKDGSEKCLQSRGCSICSMWLRRLDEEEGLNIQKEPLLYKCKTLLTVGTSYPGGHFLAGGEEGKQMSGGAGAPARLLSLRLGLSGSLGLVTYAVLLARGESLVARGRRGAWESLTRVSMSHFPEFWDFLKSCLPSPFEACLNPTFLEMPETVFGFLTECWPMCCWKRMILCSFLGFTLWEYIFWIQCRSAGAWVWAALGNRCLCEEPLSSTQPRPSQVSSLRCVSSWSRTLSVPSEACSPSWMTR